MTTLLARLLSLTFALLLAACATTTSFPAGETCLARGYAVEDNFIAARRGTCTRLRGRNVRLEIHPEISGKINPSPWFAFKIVPDGASEAVVELVYTRHAHRYWPKISNDGLNWDPIDERFVTATDDGKSARIVIPLATEPVWIAAQEIITPEVQDAWNREISAASGIPLSVLGESKAGLPIHILDSNPDSKDVLFLVGRQHPPEVSGAIAFFAFAEIVFGNTDLAREFRERFRVIAIPLLNPDGVVGGHWRLNLGGIDLNRDWGLFEQPETALVGDLLDELDASASRIRMFVDFHSTHKNVFYTQFDETDPPGFTTRWLSAAAPHITDYGFGKETRPITDFSVAKNYMFKRYGIPAVTYEVGDETDRGATVAAAGVFAEELMRTMLQQEY
ncbi:MAG: M14 family metallopeptidase [Woeseiaceae bacterium]|nr:M14 family metallopeptidase [Woeseiaceae bacterium]